MNKRNLGAAYRANTLLLLAAVGYASTRQVARSVWGRCDESSRRMASRLLRRLHEQRYVVRRREDDGIAMANQELLFALTQSGADEVRRLGSSLVAAKVHARDYLRHAHSHRTACNGVYVAWPNPSIWSELEVRVGEAPVTEFSYQMDGEKLGKIPDLIAADGRGYEWIEVENSWRSEKDLVKVVECMREMFSHSSDPHITRMHFIVTVLSAKTIGQRLKKRLTHGPDSGWPRQVKELDARILSQHLRVSEFDSETLELRTLAL
ncbi:MAG: replication-relaxation family protein [Pseudomonadales bacterium]